MASYEAKMRLNASKMMKQNIILHPNEKDGAFFLPQKDPKKCSVCCSDKNNFIQFCECNASICDKCTIIGKIISPYHCIACFRNKLFHKNSRKITFL